MITQNNTQSTIYSTLLTNEICRLKRWSKFPVSFYCLNIMCSVRDPYGRVADLSFRVRFPCFGQTDAHGRTLCQTDGWIRKIFHTDGRTQKKTRNTDTKLHAHGPPEDTKHVQGSHGLHGKHYGKYDEYQNL